MSSDFLPSSSFAISDKSELDEMGGKRRTKFPLVQKAEALNLLDKLAEKGVCSLKLERKKKSKRLPSGPAVLVFRSKQEIAAHYHVKPSAISNLIALDDEKKKDILEQAEKIKKFNLKAEKSRMQVLELFDLFCLFPNVIFLSRKVILLISKRHYILGCAKRELEAGRLVLLHCEHKC